MATSEEAHRLNERIKSAARKTGIPVPRLRNRIAFQRMLSRFAADGFTFRVGMPRHLDSQDIGLNVELDRLPQFARLLFHQAFDDLEANHAIARVDFTPALPPLAPPTFYDEAVLL
ncbi:MAG: hypothetical protein FWD59_10610 [Micrococcales bacterium]|nr:hypothetical protein [Micrococcales bacterium]